MAADPNDLANDIRVKEPIVAGESAAPATSAPASRKVDTLRDGTVPMMDPHTGALWTFPLEHARTAMDVHGYQPISAEEFTKRKAEYETHKKYGEGGVERAKALGEGALNAVTFNAGDAILAHTGLEDKEAIREHRKSFEGTRTAGELATLFGPEALNLAGKGLKAARAAKAVEGATEAGAATKAAEAAIPASAPLPEEITKAGGEPLNLRRKEPLPGEVTQPGGPSALEEKTQPGLSSQAKLDRTDKTVAPTGELPSAYSDPESTAIPRAFEGIGYEEKTMGATKGGERPVPGGKASEFENRFDSPDAEARYLRDKAAAEEVRKVIGDHATKHVLDIQARGGEVLDAGAAKVRDELAAAGQGTAGGGRRRGRGGGGPGGVITDTTPPGDPILAGPSGANLHAPIPELKPGYEDAVRAGAPAEVGGELTRAEDTTMLGHEPTQVDGLAAHFEQNPKNVYYEAGPGAPKGGPDPFAGAEARAPLDPNDPFKAAVEGATDSGPARVPFDPANPRNVVVEPPPGPKFEAHGGPTPEAVAAAAEAPPVPKTPFSPLDLLNAPNKAVFGIGKRVGSFVEEGLGSKAAGRFARGAVESVPFSVGSEVSNSEINDTPITRDHLLATMGLNALTGGVFNASLGAAADGLKKLALRIPEIGNPHAPKDPVEIARNLGASLQNVNNSVENVSREMYASGAKYDRVKQLIGGSRQMLERPPESWLNLVRDTVKDASRLPGQTGAQKLFKEAVNKFIQSADAVASDAAGSDAELFRAGDQFKRDVAGLAQREFSQNGATQEFQKIIHQTEAKWIEALQDEGYWGKAGTFQKKLNAIVKAGIEIGDSGDKPGVKHFFKKPGYMLGEPDHVFDDAKVMDFVSDLNSDKGINRMKAEDAQKVLKQWLDNRKDLIGFIKDEIYEPLGHKGKLDNLHDSLGGNDERLMAAIENDKLLGDNQKRTLFQRVISDRGTRLGVAGAMMVAGVPHAFLVTYTVSYALDRAIGLGLGSSGFESALANHGAKFGKVISTGLAEAFESGSAKGGPMAAGVLGQMGFGGKASDSKSRHEQAAHLAEQLAELTADPAKLHAKIADSTKILSVAHPEMAMEVQMAAMKAISYLASKAPRDPLPPSPYSNAPKYRPGHAEVARFETLAEAVANPLVLIRDFGNNTLTREQVEAVTATHPQLAQQIQQSAMAYLTSNQGKLKLTYQKRLSFERLTGMQLDWSSRPDAIAALQKNLPQPAQPDPSAGGHANQKKSSSAAGKDGLAAHTALDVQSALSRL